MFGAAVAVARDAGPLGFFRGWLPAYMRDAGLQLWRGSKVWWWYNLCNLVSGLALNYNLYNYIELQYIVIVIVVVCGIVYCTMVVHTLNVRIVFQYIGLFWTYTSMARLLLYRGPRGYALKYHCKNYANVRSTVSGWARTSSFFHGFSQKLVQPPKVGPLFLLMPALVEQVRRRLFGLDYIVWMVATTGTETALHLECLPLLCFLKLCCSLVVQLGAAHF